MTKIHKTQKIRQYLITNETTNCEVTLKASLPSSKKAKKLTIKVGNNKISLNGLQINALQQVLSKASLFTINNNKAI